MEAVYVCVCVTWAEKGREPERARKGKRNTSRQEFGRQFLLHSWEELENTHYETTKISTRLNGLIISSPPHPLQRKQPVC